jgi:hypothetical protein
MKQLLVFFCLFGFIKYGISQDSAMFSDNEKVNQTKLEVIQDHKLDFFTLTYQLADPFENAVLVIFDPSGRAIVQQVIYYAMDQVIITTENWPSGTYTCNLAADGNSVLTRKITIQK